MENTSGREYSLFGDPYNPPSDATALYADNEYAYVLDDGGNKEGLRIIRLEDENTRKSRLEGFIATSGTANAVAVYESFVYVADGSGGVKVINTEEKTILLSLKAREPFQSAMRGTSRFASTETRFMHMLQTVTTGW